MDLETVKCEVVEGDVAVVRLDNPPVNAHSAQMLADIPAMFDRFSELDDVRTVVLTGEGKVFCAGADIQEQNLTAELRKTAGSRKAMRAFIERRPPVFKGR
jgi:enoyl-CoA hydratase/carnithine racemase